MKRRRQYTMPPSSVDGERNLWEAERNFWTSTEKPSLLQLVGLLITGGVSFIGGIAIMITGLSAILANPGNMTAWMIAPIVILMGAVIGRFGLFVLARAFRRDNNRPS